MSGDVAEPQLVRRICGEVALDEIVVHRRTHFADFSALLSEDAPPLIAGADPPGGALGYRLTGVSGLFGQVAVPELRVLVVGVEQGVGAVGLEEFGVGDGVGPRAVVGLAGELEYPARHCDGDPVGGELSYERVEPFPGRFACERYAAARRRTSFSCSNNLIRRRASRSSPDSPVLLPGLTPSSTSAWRNHLVALPT